MSKICTIEGCGGVVQARGWCAGHYHRWTRHGSPYGGRVAEGSPMRWLREIALNSATDDCLKWPFADAGNGYGRVWTGVRSAYAHRVVCEQVNGPAPDGHDASHACGNGHRGCVNPRHLSWKTRQANFADKVTHGTDNRGGKHPNAKLTDNDVIAIKKLPGSAKHLADLYGVTSGTIRDIKARQSLGAHP